jgi:5-methyltetrahydrofolate--homocysteine methyltransferase
MEVKKGLRDAIIDFRYEDIDSIVKSALDSGLTSVQILNELRAGLVVVGDKYQNGEYFLSQLFLAAETMRGALDILQPLMEDNRSEKTKGMIILGSIEGDIHDFGKIIVSSLLTASGFQVIDLGVDVPPNDFVEKAVEKNADIIGISALLSATQPMCKKVIEILKNRGLRNKYKVILGGTGVVSEVATKKYGVDAAVSDGVQGVKIINHWLEGNF